MSCNFIGNPTGPEILLLQQCRQAAPPLFTSASRSCPGTLFPQRKPQGPEVGPGGSQRPSCAPHTAPWAMPRQGAGRSPRGSAQRSRCSSSPGTRAPSRHGLCFPETGTRSRHLINSHLTDSSVRLPTLTKVLNYCSCRFLLHLRHQHSPCDREAQHPHYPP